MRVKPNLAAVCFIAATLATSTAAVAQESVAGPEAAAAVEDAATAAEAVAPAEGTASEAVAPAEEVAAASGEASPALPSVISAPPAGKGQVVFFRPNRFVGGALRFTVRENDVDLGRLPSGRYFVHVAEPGIHQYEVGRNDTMRMEVEEGETYYVQQNISMGLVAGRAVLAPSDQAAFEGALEDMRPSDPIEE